MNLWTEELKRLTPALYATEEIPLDEKIVVAKFFALASSLSWYVVEAEEQENGDVLFFGYVDSADPVLSEWGYFTLRQLESLTWNGIARVERDQYFRPVRFKELNLNN